MDKKYDVIIVGTGVAGLFAALNLPRTKKIAMITKSSIEESDSFLAQGGICILKNEDDYPLFFEDTMRAGHYENDKSAVEQMIRESQSVIRQLVDYGVEFERDQGEFRYTKEGAHSAARILYHEDLTGKEITSKLLEKVQELSNVTIFTQTTMIDILEKENICYGVVLKKDDGTISTIFADYTIWASGGIGGLYDHSTNFRHLTGDALAISMKHGVALLNVDYVQIHPTTLYSMRSGRRFLISESVRGEGALLYDKNGERFVDELLPRDVLSKEIYAQMQKDKTNYVKLSLEKMSSEDIMKRFPNIYQRCLDEGYDITKESIPVVPAQHYFMGGVKVDLDGKTSMERLYAAGETACNGVHGANRLASNSLLESLVWARRAAIDIGEHYEAVCTEPDFEKQISKYLAMNEDDIAYIMLTYKDKVRRKIKEDGKKRETQNADLWKRD